MTEAVGDFGLIGLAVSYSSVFFAQKPRETFDGTWQFAMSIRRLLPNIWEATLRHSHDETTSRKHTDFKT